MTTADVPAPADTATPTDAPADPPAPTDTPTADPAEPDTDDAAKWKALARKHESELKKVTKALADKEKAALTDQERAIAEAKDAGKAEARREAAAELAAAKLEAAGVPGDVIEDLNLGRFVGDDGTVDSALIAATAAKFAGTAKPKAPPVPTGPQNGGGQPAQLDRAALASMTPDQIVEAKAKGQLNDLLGIKT
jgi:hypothetical protein